MKRRDFLITTGAGIVGVAVPRWSAAQGIPCPPPKLAVGGGAEVGSECVAAGQAPRWFLEQAPGTWLAIAGPATAVGRGGTLDAVKPDLERFALGGTYRDHASLTTAWTGACVDQDRNEYLMVANGGHADYCGNEAYALRLSLENPMWCRLNDPTPGVDSSPATSPAVYADGRSKAMHTSGHQQYVDGRVWFSMQTSATSQAGGSSFSVVSFDRRKMPDAIPVSQGGSGAVPYAGSVNPWNTSYGRLGNFGPGNTTDGIHFALTALDAATGDIWQCPTSSTNPKVPYVRTRTFSTGYVTNSAGWSMYPNAFIACAHDLRLLIVGIWARNQVYVKRLDDDAAPFEKVDLPNDGFDWDSRRAWSFPGYGPNEPPGVNRPYPLMSAEYHEATKSILIVNPVGMGGTVRRLTIPTTNSVYDRNGSWRWSTHAAATPSGMTGVRQGTFNKCRMIRDMGNNGSALVYCESTTAATYVYKV